MSKLLVNSTDLVNQFINRYQIWKDCKNFYNNSSDPYLIGHDSAGIPCFHYTDIDSINNSTGKIIAIDCLTEGIHSIDYFNRYRSDRHYIIFSNGWWDTEKYKFSFSYNLVWHLFFLFEMCDTYNSPNRFCYYIKQDYNFDYPKSCVFVSTIGYVRPERTELVEWLCNTLTYKNFILRYSGQDLGVESSALDVINFTPGNFDPYTSILEKYYHNVSQSLPLNLYNQGYFNLIVESDSSPTDEFFLTEKTIKSLITGQPFVIFSTSNFLQHLRSLGFKTYDSVWNENYDQIDDFHSRAKQIAELCNQLSKFDWNTHKQKLKEIKQHNQQTFNRLAGIADQEFLNLETTIKECKWIF
jgi:hypothetical protein